MVNRDSHDQKDIPDYTKLSLGELYRIHQLIDRERFPDRDAAVLQEISRREKKVFNGDNRCEKKEKSIFFIIAWLFFLQGIFGYILLITRVLGSHIFSFPWTLVLLLIPLPSLGIGMFLWRENYLGIILAIIFQIIQVPYFATGQQIFSYQFGLVYILKFPWRNGQWGFNLIALAVLLAALKAKERIDSQEKSGQQEKGQEKGKGSGKRVSPRIQASR